MCLWSEDTKILSNISFGFELADVTIKQLFASGNLEDFEKYIDLALYELFNILHNV